MRGTVDGERRERVEELRNQRESGYRYLNGEREYLYFRSTAGVFRITRPLVRHAENTAEAFHSKNITDNGNENSFPSHCTYYLFFQNQKKSTLSCAFI